MSKEHANKQHMILHNNKMVMKKLDSLKRREKIRVTLFELVEEGEGRRGRHFTLFFRTLWLEFLSSVEHKRR